jgi:hypothetical protein
VHRMARDRLIGAAIAITAGFLATPPAAGAQAERPAKWDVAGVSADGRAVDVYYEGGGCGPGSVRTTAVETATSVAPQVFAMSSPPPPGGSCPPSVARKLASVPLAAPLGGRAIKGRAFPAPFDVIDYAPNSAVAYVRVPRLVGMSPWEAKRALRLRRLEVALARSTARSKLPQVRHQTPAAGLFVKVGTTIRLKLARRR